MEQEQYDYQKMKDGLSKIMMEFVTSNKITPIDFFSIQMSFIYATIKMIGFEERQTKEIFNDLIEDMYRDKLQQEDKNNG